jgi:hypothetical protein
VTLVSQALTTLTCLIAAVFSEPVWEGARVYLTTLIGRWTGESQAGAHTGQKAEHQSERIP